MPELPEVETIAQRLQTILPGKRIRDVAINKEKSFIGPANDLIGQTIESVSRRAKVIHFHLSSQQLLLTHLKMTGQLIYVDHNTRVGGGHPTADWVQELPSAHTRISYTFADGSQLFFNDQRIFGWMKLVNPDEADKEFATLGPDVNWPTFTAEYLAEKMKKKSQPIKQLLLDPTVVAGIGNIYVCDTLNLARVSPFRAANSLRFEEVEAVVAAAKTIIERGIQLKGTTFDGKYVGVDGFAGGYQAQVLVYGRESQPCFNCGSPILKTQLGGRGTYYCGVCQK